MKKEEVYYLGKITRSHGLKGNVVLMLDTDQPEMYERLDSIFVEINGLLVPFFIDRQSWSRGDSKIISFKNSTQALVEQLLGKNVFLPLSTLPPLSGKQFYYHEVKGFQVMDADGRSYGEITEINDQTAQHLFMLNREGKDVIIPLIKDWIQEVDRDAKRITMNLPEGLLEVFTEPAVRDE